MRLDGSHIRFQAADHQVVVARMGNEEAPLSGGAREGVKGPSLFNGDDLVLFPVNDQGGDRDLPDLQVVSEADSIGDVPEQVRHAQSSQLVPGTREPALHDQPFKPVLIVEGNLDGRRASQGPAHDEETARIAAILQKRDKPVKGRMGVADKALHVGLPVLKP